MRHSFASAPQARFSASFGTPPAFHQARPPAADHTPSPAGHWKLATGHAVSLQCASAGVLRIAQGRVWATLDGPHAGPPNDQGDVFLAAGQQITLQPGQRVVLEPWDPPALPSAASYFSWDPAPAPACANLQAGSRWQVAVAYPVHDVGVGLVLAGRALGRLLKGLAGLAEFVVAGRGQVQPCLESNQP